MTTTQRFIENTARLMEDQNVSAGGICRVTGMSDTHVSGILSGRVGITLRTVERFAKVFGVEPWEMIGPKIEDP